MNRQRYCVPESVVLHFHSTDNIVTVMYKDVSPTRFCIFYVQTFISGYFTASLIVNRCKLIVATEVNLFMLIIDIHR